VGLNSTRFLLALGDLVIGWLLLRQAEVALAKLSDGEDPFYLGKVGAASFFAKTVLPRLTAERRVLVSTGQELMELPEEAF
jgi:hypothetical protein